MLTSPLPIRSIHRVLLTALLLTMAFGTHPIHAQSRVIVEISGDLTESQRQNIRSFVSLCRVPDNEMPSEAVFNRLYGKAQQEAAKALEPFGYYTPEIVLSQYRKNNDRHVVINVRTGEPVLVEEVHIEVSGEGKHDETLKKAIGRFPIRPGDVLDHQRYENSKDALIAAALEYGYHRAVFRDNRVAIRRKSRSASMRLQLDTGPRYRFGPLNFDADFIDHDLLRKIAPVREGDPFSPRALTRLRQSFFNANYFKTVELDYDLDRAVTHAVPVNVLLTPNLAHKYGIGLGYGTDTGARGTLEYANRHINRLGHQLEVQLQPAQRKNNLSGTYTIPIGDPKRDRLTLVGKYETEEFDTTDTETLHAIVSHDHFREKGEYSTYLQLLDERYTTGADTDQAALIIPGIKGSLFWADDRIVTKRGIRFTATAIGSEDSILADTTFLQTTLRTKAIYSFLEQWRILGRAEIGTTLIDDIYDLPPSLRFYAGGDQSVRGYGYKKIGPTDAQGNVLGGKNLLTYSAELERSLFDEWSGAIFYDSGAAMNTFSNISFHSGAGIGIRWNGVFGQIRLDLARSLDEEGAWRIHFTMGADL